LRTTIDRQIKQLDLTIYSWFFIRLF